MDHHTVLDNERAKSDIDVEQITVCLHGGAAKLAVSRKFQEIVKNDPSFATDDEIFICRTERFQKGLMKAKRMEEIADEMGLSSEEHAVLYEAIGESSALLLHRLMFIPIVKALFTDEQREEWDSRMENLDILGCYAQTELGHGSNIRALETTATFDPETDEFILHSPTITARKWWPGGLGKVGTHAMVIARLVTGGKDYGIHNFIVPIRDPETHMPLPGVEVGDIGPKMGFLAVDNGYLALDKVRVPHRYMAMRYQTVDRNGRYQRRPSPHEKVSSIAMMQVRASIVRTSGRDLAKGVTIATRYSAVRRQGYDEDAGPLERGKEKAVLDHALQQHRLFPLLAAAYAHHFAGEDLWGQFEAVREMVARGDPAAGPAFAELHANSSGLKALCTEVTGHGIEECRKSCGGHGYLLASGFPELWGTYMQTNTVEGDNHLLAQQVLKYLLKALRAARGGEGRAPAAPAGAAAYLGDAPALLAAAAPPPGGGGGLGSPEGLGRELARRALRLVLRVEAVIAQALKQGSTQAQAWNRALTEIYHASKAHCKYLVFKSFSEGLEARAAAGALAGPGLAALRRLRDLYGLRAIEQDLGDFTEDGRLALAHADWVRDRIQGLLVELRPDAVPLVDAWGFSDFALRSALGRYDGKVYEALIESTRVNPLNQREPVQGYEEYLRPILKSQKKKQSTRLQHNSKL